MCVKINFCKILVSLTSIFSLLSAILTTESAIAAGPITHAYLAERWMHYREHFNEEASDSFMRGTLFPDIRYLGVILRKETHGANLSIGDVLKDKSPFSKGKNLHAFIDEEREKMVSKWGIYDKIKDIPGQQYKTAFLKLLEDEILFQKSNWKDVKESLKSLDGNEKLYKISEENLIKWHKLLGKSFSVSPSKQLETLAKHDKYFFNVPPKVVRRWAKIIPSLSRDPEIQEYVSNLTNHFDQLFKSLR